MPAVQWFFQVNHQKGEEADGAGWDWSKGAPDIRSLLPARAPRSTAKSRHIPVRAFCATTGTHLGLESGFEHDLLRVVDRDPQVAWVVAQPLLLVFPQGDDHIPDFLTVTADGAVTVWDARPKERVDDKTHAKALRTGAACREVGWQYELWTGLAREAQLSHIWLARGRRRPAWAHQYIPTLAAASQRPGATIGDLRALDSGRGELVSTMWHLLWTGQIVVDPAVQIQDHTVVSWRGDAA